VDPILALLAEGKKMEAVKAYREAHPDVGIVAARLAVEELAAKMTIAAQQPAAPDGAPSLAPLGTAPRG
jgi:ribosomal protein L7/L12